MHLHHRLPSADTRTGHWTIDQTALLQGIDAQACQQFEQTLAQASTLWPAVVGLAQQQPIVSSLDAAGLAQMQETIAGLEEVADRLVVIGTGGASLGAQTLCAFAPKPGKVVFLENCDAHSANTILTQGDLSRTAWVIISKSGETVETLAASLAVIAAYSKENQSLEGRVAVITSPGTRPLRTLAEHHGWQVLEHPPQLGGRFSVFSVVGLFPAAFAGLDSAELMDTAHRTWDDALAKQDASLLAAASWFFCSLKQQPLHVVMGYGDRLRPYTQWYKQLWAESLGKAGGGPTPITSVGSIDQHSQLQLYLGGARDKLFTLILPEGEGVHVPLANAGIPEIDYLSGHSLQDIMHASAEATCATMRSKNLPLRVLTATLSAQSLVELMARTMLETLLVAVLLEVDPYSQPAVEEGKQRARKNLGLLK